MAHGYRTLQHWDQWLSQQFLGSSLLAAEQNLLSSLLQNHFGKQALLIGVPNQKNLLNATTVVRHSIISPLTHRETNAGMIEGDFHELPILTGSVDLVMLPHTLEFVDNPRRLLAEACRITKPEGLIVISGFNPYSAWGLKRLLHRKKIAPWSGNFIQQSKIMNWLRLAHFDLEQQKHILFRPPMSSEHCYHKLHFLERLGSVCFPRLGGSYVLIARAKVIPLTPIRLKWKQQLTGIRIANTISGHIARHLKHL